MGPPLRRFQASGFSRQVLHSLQPRCRRRSSINTNRWTPEPVTYSKMIRPKEARIPLGEERLEEIEGPWGAGLDEPVPGEISGRKVPGVELGELANVQRDALPGPCSADNLTVSYGVLAR